MLRVLICVALFVSSCAFQPPAPRYQFMTVARPAKTEIRTEKIRVACPTDDQIRDAIIASSRATYRINPYTTGHCGCLGDWMINDKPCTNLATWVMCTPADVDTKAPGLVEKIRLSLPAECRR